MSLLRSFVVGYGPRSYKYAAPTELIFKREEGFFVGAIMANVVTTEVLILIVYFACLLFTHVGDQTMLTILFVVGVTFPLAFYHHSWALWLGLDHLIETLPRGKK